MANIIRVVVIGLSLIFPTKIIGGEKLILSQEFIKPEVKTTESIRYFPLRLIDIIKTKEAPKIDGKLDENCWKEAPLVTDFVILGTTDKLMQKKTAVRIIYDDKNIYIGFECAEPELDKIVKDRIWEEGIEVFFDTKHDHKTYFQIGVTPGGVTGQTGGLDKTWAGKWNVKTSCGDKKWLAEIAVPFESLNTKRPEAGTVWGLNLCRSHTGPIYGSWPPLMRMSGGFHKPHLFADLYFAGEKRLPYVIDSLVLLNGPSLGVNKAKIRIINRGDDKGDLVIKSKVLTGGENSPDSFVRLTVPKGKGVNAEISYTVEKLGEKTELIIVLLSSDSKNEYYKCKYSLNVPSCLLDLKLEGNTYFMEEESIPVFVKINASDVTLRNSYLKLQLKKKIGNEILDTEEIKNLSAADAVIKLKILDLPAEEFVILTELLSKDGKTLDNKEVSFKKVKGVAW